MANETTFWKGSPSQWINLGHFSLGILIICGVIAGGLFQPYLFIGLVIPAVYMLWSYLTVRCKTYELTTERLRITTGVLNHEIDEVELYRVKDILVKRKWWMRLTKLGTVHLQTSDRTLPEVDIIAVKDCIGLREEMRKLVEAVRDHKRVREMDFDNTDGEDGFGDLEEIG